ncbi:MAG: pilus assembly PilX N-terminal domain-containing protein [Desulfobacterales bacterium]|nr:pilus assembly PilX N-terminal domain-containing protein [Desulfobacterales bacterium]
MKRKILFFNNDEGSAMLISLVIMLLLTMLGLSMMETNARNTEISGNTREYKENLYLSESSNMDVLQLLQNEVDNVAPLNNLLPSGASCKTWIIMTGAANFDRTNINNWTLPPAGVVEQPGLNSRRMRDATIDPSFPFPQTELFASVVFQGYARGSSEDVGQPDHLYEYAVFGLSRKTVGGQVINTVLETGYRERF